MPDRLKQILDREDEVISVKVQRICERAKTLLVLQSETSTDTVLFDHKGNDLAYESYKTGDLLEKMTIDEQDVKADQVFSDHRGRIYRILDI